MYDIKLGLNLTEKDFIEHVILKERFTFAFFSKNIKIPKYLESRLFNEIKDNNTGERFYIID